MKDKELRLQLLRHYKAVTDLAVRGDKYGTNGVGYYKSDRDYFKLALNIDFDKCYDSEAWQEVSVKHRDDWKEIFSFLTDKEVWWFIGDTITQILHNRLTGVAFKDINEEFEKELSSILNKTLNTFNNLDQISTLKQQVEALQKEIAELRGE